VHTRGYAGWISNQFSLPSSSTSTRALLYTVQLPGAGKLAVVDEPLAE